VIEDVEDFRPEFHTHLFTNRVSLKNSHVPIVDRRVATERARGVAKVPSALSRNWWDRRQNRRCAGCGFLNGASISGFPGPFEAQRAALQLLVVAVVDQDGEAALVGINAGNLPTIQGFPFKALELWNGQLPDVIKDEAMPRAFVERWE